MQAQDGGLRPVAEKAYKRSVRTEIMISVFVRGCEKLGLKGLCLLYLSQQDKNPFRDSPFFLVIDDENIGYQSVITFTIKLQMV